MILSEQQTGGNKGILYNFALNMIVLIDRSLMRRRL